jgi:tautomerase-like protein
VPLVEVHLQRPLFEASHDDIGRAIHGAQVDALGIPEDDRFQVFSPHDAGELKFDPGYNGVDRRDLLLIRIVAVRMYSVATKQKFFSAVVDRLTSLGIRPDDILISWTENGFEDWYAGRL